MTIKELILEGFSDQEIREKYGYKNKSIRNAHAKLAAGYGVGTPGGRVGEVKPRTDMTTQKNYKGTEAQYQALANAIVLKAIGDVAVIYASDISHNATEYYLAEARRIEEFLMDHGEFFSGVDGEYLVSAAKVRGVQLYIKRMEKLGRTVAETDISQKYRKYYWRAMKWTN